MSNDKQTDGKARIYSNKTTRTSNGKVNGTITFHLENVPEEHYIPIISSIHEMEVNISKTINGEEVKKPEEKISPRSPPTKKEPISPPFSHPPEKRESKPKESGCPRSFKDDVDAASFLPFPSIYQFVYVESGRQKGNVGVIKNIEGDSLCLLLKEGGITWVRLSDCRRTTENTFDIERK